MLAVVKEKTPLYLGEDRDRAIAVFESNPGSNLTRLESLEAFASLLSGAQPHSCKSDCCQQSLDPSVYKSPTLEEIEEFLREEWDTIGSTIVESFWANLEMLGFSKEKVNKAWDETKVAAKKAAELTNKEGLAVIGDLLVRMGNSLIDHSK